MPRPFPVPKPSRRRALAAAALIAGSAATLALSQTPTATAAPTAAGGHGQSPLTDVVVELRTGVGDPGQVAGRQMQRLHGRVVRVFTTAVSGYSARLPQDAIRELRSDPDVVAVEPDAVISLAVPPDDVHGEGTTTQYSPTWGLDRIDQHMLPLDHAFRETATGAGVTAYVIDTGIRLSHTDFDGRAVTGTDLVDGGSADDCNGHGTHVAGTLGGRLHGVAKDARIVAVRVLDCSGSGSLSRVIAGVDWVTRDHQSGQPAVANMSLGGAASSVLDAAIRNSIADGITYAVAAGNGTSSGTPQDSCTVSPARVGPALTVSATTASDARASWAGYGSCVDLFAPGVGITSAWIGSDTATKRLSGTSMASPHVAGVAALYLEDHPTSSPATVRRALVAAATTGVVTDSMTTDARLLFTSW